MFLRTVILCLALAIGPMAGANAALAQGAPVSQGLGGTGPAPAGSLPGASAPASEVVTGPRSPQPAAAPPSASVGEHYRLGPGDKVRIIVYGEPALSGEFFVSGSGLISFPLVGDVPAANLSVQQFQTKLEDALRQGYLKEPRASAEVLTYRPYYILGEVNKPGEYPYSNGLNVLNAVATAGGFTYRAQKKRVYIRRVNETAEKTYDLTSDLVVAPGDTIRVTERFF
jgi:polysaccharide export outer membrane protein